MDLIEVNTVSTHRHPWELARYQILSTLIDSALEKQGEKWILDIGAGDAFFAKRLLTERNDVNIIVVDTGFSENMIKELADARINKRLFFFKDLEEAEKMMENFTVDLVLLLDVIEHIQDHESFMARLARHSIYNKATFLITVPAFQTLYTEHDAFLKHYRRYNLSTLNQLLFKTGFQTVKTGYFFMVLLLLRMGEKLLEKMGRKYPAKGIGKWQGTENITRLLLRLLVIDFKVSIFLRKGGIRMPGLSLYCLCKKRV